jgi:hypothetical protein
MATLRAGFLPVMSVSLPLIGVMIVCASRYEVAIQEYSDGLALSSVAIVGKAVEMIYMSALISGIPYRLIQGSDEGDQSYTEGSDEPGMRRWTLRTKALQSRGDSDARLICKRQDRVSAEVGSLTSHYQPVILQSLLVFLVHGSRRIGLFVGLGFISHGSGSRAPKIRFRRFKAFEAVRYMYNAAKLDRQAGSAPLRALSETSTVRMGLFGFGRSARFPRTCLRIPRERKNEESDYPHFTGAQMRQSWLKTSARLGLQRLLT